MFFGLAHGSFRGLLQLAAALTGYAGAMIAFVQAKDAHISSQQKVLVNPLSMKVMRNNNP